MRSDGAATARSGRVEHCTGNGIPMHHRPERVEGPTQLSVAVQPPIAEADPAHMPPSRFRKGGMLLLRHQTTPRPAPRTAHCRRVEPPNRRTGSSVWVG